MWLVLLWFLFLGGSGALEAGFGLRAVRGRSGVTGVADLVDYGRFGSTGLVILVIAGLVCGCGGIAMVSFRWLMIKV